jgi:hypothetical protein
VLERKYCVVVINHGSEPLFAEASAVACCDSHAEALPMLRRDQASDRVNVYVSESLTAPLSPRLDATRGCDAV